MRRGPGIAGLQRGHARQQALGAVGQRLEASNLQTARAQLESLRAALQDFAQKHRARINSDPPFRQAFFEMCVTVGVDPLASSKNVWDEILGVGQFYNELAVQVLTVCLQTRDLNGGLLDMRECLSSLKRSRPGADPIDSSDVMRAVDRLSALGKGVGTRRCAGRWLVFSVPAELSPDSTRALEVATANSGKVCSEELVSQLKWTKQRSQAALAHFVREGLCWIDSQDEAVERWYWFPSIALGARDAPAAGTD